MERKKKKIESFGVFPVYGIDSFDSFMLTEYFVCLCQLFRDFAWK